MKKVAKINIRKSINIYKNWKTSKMATISLTHEHSPKSNGAAVEYKQELIKNKIFKCLNKYYNKKFADARKTR
jgi:hypothetical protein